MPLVRVSNGGSADAIQIMTMKSSSRFTSYTLATEKDCWYAVVTSGNVNSQISSVTNAENLQVLGVDVNNGVGISVFKATSTSSVITLTSTSSGGDSRVFKLSYPIPKSSGLIAMLAPSISSGNSWSITYSGITVGSQIVLDYYVTSGNFGTTVPTVTGATVEYSNFYSYTTQIKMILKATSSSITVSGSKPNTNSLVGASWQVA